MLNKVGLWITCLVASLPCALVGAEDLGEIDLKEWERKDWIIPTNPTDNALVSSHEEFMLWNDCDPVFLIVEDLSYEARQIGLTEDRIQTAVESRLRSARIYSESADSNVYVNVNTSGSAVSFSFEFRPLVIRAGFMGHAQTWKIASVGTFSSNAGYLIIQTVSEYADKFINEYLRVNASACK